jgi:hypothetical protein
VREQAKEKVMPASVPNKRSSSSSYEFDASMSRESSNRKLASADPADPPVDTTMKMSPCSTTTDMEEEEDLRDS